MEWWNFSNPGFLTLFISFTTVIVLFIFFVVSFFLSNYFEQRNVSNIKQASTTARIFVIDFKNDIVIYFDKNNIGKKHKTNLVGFYSSFHENDADKVKDWIYSICVRRKDVENFIEADVLIDRGKENYFSLLQLIKYDSEAGLVHVESHIMKYITPNNSSIKVRHGVNYGVINKSKMADMITSMKAAKGYTYAIRFYYIKPLVNVSSRYETLVAMNLKDVIYPYANDLHHIRQIVDNNTNQVLLFDLNITSTEAAVQLATSIENDIKKAISLSSYKDSISFAIGIANNADYYQDFDSVVDCAEQACIYAQQNGLTTYLYIRSKSRHVVTTKKLETQIDKLFVNNTMRFLYRPIIDVSKEKIVGYFQYVKVYDLPFSDFYEMQKYAIKVGKNKDLFSLIAKGGISRFISQSSSLSDRLFLNASLFDFEYLHQTISQIKDSSSIQIVLTFDGEEIYDNTSDSDNVNSSLNQLKDNGYRLALFIKDENLIIDPITYTKFDYFIVGASMVGEIKRSTRSRLSIISLIEQLLKYHKPIIATDLGSSQAIEIIIKSGIYLISSEGVSPSSEMLLPVDKKKLQKLHSNYEKYN